MNKDQLYKLCKETLVEKCFKQEQEIERLEKENERYCIAINEMAINISKAIDYMERYMFSQKENYDYIHLLAILKGR